MDRNTETARSIALRAAEAGGRAYYVGGCVRDRLMGVPSADTDIEVHRLAPATLMEILRALGEPSLTGAGFGVFRLRHCPMDITVPVSFHSGRDTLGAAAAPFMGEKAAALRRDFTVNALMQDILTGEIYDFFGGKADIEAGILRHVSPLTFGDDPLRAVRAARFAACQGFAIAPETLELCRSLSLEAVPRERIAAETEKVLLLSDKPRVFFEALRAMGQLHPWFSETEAHTAAADAGAACRATAADPLGFMLAMLCRNMQPAGSAGLINRLFPRSRTAAYAGAMLRDYRRITGECPSRHGLMLIFDKSPDPEALVLMCGRKYEAALMEYRCLCSQPMVTAGDLLALGIKPGPRLGKALSHARSLSLKGIKKSEALREALKLYEE